MHLQKVMLAHSVHTRTGTLPCQLWCFSLPSHSS